MSTSTPVRPDRLVQLAEEPRRRPARPDPPPFLGAPANSPVAWLLPVVALAGTAAGALFLLRGPDGAFAVAFGLLVAAGGAWVAVSILFPAGADRTCPKCRKKALGRIDRDSTTGVVCAHCGWSDETASAHLISESEGPFEDAVLRQRGRR